MIYVTGLYTYHTIFFIVMLKCTFSTYLKEIGKKQYAVLQWPQSHTSYIYYVS